MRQLDTFGAEGWTYYWWLLEHFGNVTDSGFKRANHTLAWVLGSEIMKFPLFHRLGRIKMTLPSVFFIHFSVKLCNHSSLR